MLRRDVYCQTLRNAVLTGPELMKYYTGIGYFTLFGEFKGFLQEKVSADRLPPQLASHVEVCACAFRGLPCDKAGTGAACPATKILEHADGHGEPAGAGARQ